MNIKMELDKENLLEVFMSWLLSDKIDRLRFIENFFSAFKTHALDIFSIYAKIASAYREQPEMKDAYSRLAILPLADEDVMTAISLLVRDSDDNRISWEGELLRAEVLYRTGHKEKAQSLVDHVYNNQDMAKDGYANIAWFACNHVRSDALLLFERDVALKRISSNSRILFAEFLGQHGECEKGIHQVVTAYRENPELSGGFFRLLRAIGCSLQKNDVVAFEKCFFDAIESSDNGNRQRAMEYQVVSGEFAVYNNKIIEAESIWRKLLDSSLSEAPPHAFARLAQILRIQSKFMEAKQILEKGMVRHPHYISIYTGYADLAMENMDWQKAAQRWQHILISFPKNVIPQRAYENLASALERCGASPSQINNIASSDVGLIRTMCQRKKLSVRKQHFPGRPAFRNMAIRKLLNERHIPNIIKQFRLSENQAKRIIETEHVFPSFREHCSKGSPPDTSIAFACVCNAKFIPGLECLLLSLKNIYPNIHSDFYVYHDGTISDFARKRLICIYSKLFFKTAKPSKYDINLTGANNHNRIGRLGYLSLEALQLTDYKRVIIIDTDILVLDDFSPMWLENGINVVMDAASLGSCVVSTYTNRPIFNSGLISLPQEFLIRDAYKKALHTLTSIDKCTCPTLNSFADQKFWNIFLAKEHINYLPNNFNCLLNLFENVFPEQLHNISVLHVIGTKPWYSFANKLYLSSRDRADSYKLSCDNPISYNLWMSVYRKLLRNVRKQSFDRDMGNMLAYFKNKAQHKSVLLIGNGPSIKHTDFSRFKDMIKVAFNGFIRHKDFDHIKPDHLIISSHNFFGGWGIYDPCIPDDFLGLLNQHTHKPVIWFPYYFKEYIETIKALRKFDIGYVLFEHPNCHRAADIGTVFMDMSSYLTDCHTGVVAIGVPLAVHMGCKEIILVGCDSNYTTNLDGDYFYKSGAWLTTPDSVLKATWAKNGPGPYVYRLAKEQLSSMGIDFVDATVDGSLAVLPRYEHGM